MIMSSVSEVENEDKKQKFLQKNSFPKNLIEQGSDLISVVDLDSSEKKITSTREDDNLNSKHLNNFNLNNNLDINFNLDKNLEEENLEEENLRGQVSSPKIIQKTAEEVQHQEVLEENKSFSSSSKNQEFLQYKKSSSNEKEEEQQQQQDNNIKKISEQEDKDNFYIQKEEVKQEKKEEEEVEIADNLFEVLLKKATLSRDLEREENENNMDRYIILEIFLFLLLLLLLCFFLIIKDITNINFCVTKIICNYIFKRN